MQKARILIPLAMIFGCMMSYGALTNADYANETWRLVWDGASPMTLSPGEATRLQCHWESSLGRREVALVTVVSGNAGKDSYGRITAQGTGCVGISITRNVTHTSSFNSLSFYDDNVRYFNLRIGDYSRPGQAYHQIEKPKMTVNGGTTNITISWGVKHQSDNHMVAAEVYRSELTDDGLVQKTPYELIYGEYDEDKVKSGAYSWTDYSVKLGVAYSYCVRVYGIGIIDDTKTLMIGYNTGGDFRTSDAGVAQTKACAIIYENLRGATPKNPSYYVPGTIISFANPSPIPGGIFQGWTPESILSTATGRQIVSANWILDKFNVSFDGNGGTLNDYGIGSVSSRMEYGDEIVKPEVMRIGYTFTGWSPGVAVTVPANDVTYVAQWSINRYQVTFDANGGEGGKSEELDYGSVIEMPSVARTGYTFMGWDSPVAAMVPTNDVTYVARWRTNKYSVVFDANGGEGGTSMDQVDYDERIVMPTVSRFGYALDCWQTEIGQRVVPDYQGEISKLTSEDGGVVTLYAVWKAPKFYVNASGALWYAEQNSVSDIIVPDGVINITSQPFRYFGTARIILPQSLRNIDDWAFEDFGNLMDITIPDNSVTNIGKGAFAECTNLTSVVIPGSVVTVGTQAFSGCSEVTNLVISYGLHDIGWYAFSACTKLANLQIPGSVTNIGAGAFSDCSSLTSVTMPRSVTRIGGYAFGCCSKLTIVHVVMGDKARIKGLLEDSGFDTSGVTFVEDVAWNPDPVPPTPVISHTVTFDANGGSVLLTTRAVADGEAVGVLPVASHDGWMFNGWFTAAVDGEQVSDNATITGDITLYAQWKVNQYTVTFDANGGTGGTAVTQDYGTSLVAPVVTRTGYTFKGWAPAVPATVSAGNATYVAQWEVNKYTTTLELNGGDGEEQIVVPHGTKVGELPVPTRTGHAFAGWFTAATGGDQMPDDTAITGDMTLYAVWNDSGDNPAPSGEDTINWSYSVSGLNITVTGASAVTSDLTIPCSIDGKIVTEIGNEAFYRCDKLTSVTIPDCVTNIAWCAFESCSNLTKVVLPNGLMNIGGRAFYECGNLKDVTVSQCVLDKMLLNVFQPGRSQGGYKSITNVTFTADVVRIPNSALAECRGLVGVTIPESVTNIGYSAFSNCESLKSIRFLGDEPHVADRSAFRGVNMDCVVYVKKRSSSWGVDIPGVWNGLRIEYFDEEFSGSALYSPITYENLRGAANPNPATYREGTLVSFLNPGAVTGYTFAGWMPAQITADMTGAQTVRAAWTANGYSIAYNANGGSGTMNATAATYDSVTNLAANGFTWAGHVFAGWATNATGEVIYAAGQPVTNLTAQSSGVVTLYAVWEDLVVAAPTVAPGDGTVFTKESCMVTLSCATEGADIYYNIGSAPRATARYLYSGPFTITGTAEIYTFARKDGVNSDPVTKVTITKRSLSLAEAAGAAELEFTTGGDASWTPVGDTTAASGLSAQSGMIGDDSETWIQTSVAGAGTFSFNWKVECEEDYIAHEAGWDHLAVSTNGTNGAWIEVLRIDGASGWRPMSITFADAGTHTIRWTFVKDGDQEEAFADLAWLSGVTWTCNGSAEPPFPEVATNAAPETVAAALAGAADAGLAANVTDGTNYNVFCEWAARVKDSSGSTAAGAQTVKESAKAWLSYALGADRLITKEITSNDVHIAKFEISSATGGGAMGASCPTFAFEVAIDGVEIGSGSVVESVLKENLKKVLGIEGTASLTPAAFSSDNIDITFDTPVDGKAKFTVAPPADAGNSFFMRVKVK